MEKLDEIVFYTLEKSMKVYRRFAQNQIQQNGYDITVDQWLVLKTLSENQHLSQNQVAEMVFKDMASITRIIEILTQKDYVTRELDLKDRRKFKLKISNKGKKIIQSIYPIVQDYRKQALKGLNSSDVNALKTQLEKIILNCH